MLDEIREAVRDPEEARRPTSGKVFGGKVYNKTT